MARESLAWTLVKHSALVAFAVMAVLVALHGDGDPIMTVAYGATAFLLVLTFIVADRARFLAHDATPHVMLPSPEVHFQPGMQPTQLHAVAGYAPQLPHVPMTVPPPAPAASFQVNVT